MSFYIHPTAEVSDKASIGDGTRIWHQAQVREGVSIGSECIIGKGAYVDFDVVVGDRCKLQNGVFVYHGATLEDGVFLGPGAMILNDKHPRAVTADGNLKTDDDWEVSSCNIGQGAGIGGRVVILPGVSVGKWAIVGAGSVVTRNVPDYGLAYGNPARLAGFVCPCGQRLTLQLLSPQETVDKAILECPSCNSRVAIPLEVYHQIL